MSTDPEKIKQDGMIKYMADGRVSAAPTFPHLALLSTAT
jgi:hypothetical protein